MDSQKMIDDWLVCYKRAGDLKEAIDTEVLFECSKVHYHHMDMDRVLDEYVGELDAFLTYIGHAWGWSVRKTQEAGMTHLFIDENKDYCVCPLVNKGVIRSSSLCECSKAFNKQVFEKVLNKEVEVTLGNTYIRNKKSCEYRITYSDRS